MRKKYTLLIPAFAAMTTVMQAQSDMSINVLYLDGSNHVTAVADVDRISIADGTVSVITKGGATQQHATGSIDRIWFNSNGTGISTPVKAAGTITVAVSADNISVSGASASATVDVYDTAGRRVAAGVCSEGRATVSTARLATGTYVVSVDGLSRKFIKR